VERVHYLDVGDERGTGVNASIEEIVRKERVSDTVAVARSALVRLRAVRRARRG
jgi:hypothetical protein